jgi:hypothetical protein
VGNGVVVAPDVENDQTSMPLSPSIAVTRPPFEMYMIPFTASGTDVPPPCIGNDQASFRLATFEVLIYVSGE